MLYHWYEVDAVARERMRDRLREAEALSLARRVAPEAGSSGSLTLLPGEGGRRGIRATLVLSRGELLSLRVGRLPHRVVCVAGGVWVTGENSGSDHVLAVGEQWTFGDSGRVVIQALRLSTVRIDSAAAARVAMGSALRPALLPG